MDIHSAAGMPVRGPGLAGAKEFAPVSVQVGQHAEPVDPQDALAALLTPMLAEASIARKITQPASVVAGEILRCVRGNEFDTRALSGTHIDLLLADLPPAGWAALQRHASSQSEFGITCATLSHNLCLALRFRPGATLIEGLSGLPLQYLALQDPPKGEVDLSRLGNETAMPAIEIQCNDKDPGPFTVFVPQGTDVSAKAHGVASRPSSVIYVAHGQGVAQKVLGGLIYHRKPTDFSMDPEAALAVMLNGKVQYPAHATGIVFNGMIWCRDLAIQWLRDRAEHHAGKVAHGSLQGPHEPPASPAGTGRFAYTNFMSPPAISANVGWDTTNDYRRLANQGAQALFEAGQFGDLMAEEFEGLGNGQTRQLVISTPNHALAAELRVKDGEYVVSFYDPNSTATHERLVVGNPASLRGRSIQKWIGSDLMDHYFGKGEVGRIGAIYRWPEGATQPEGTQAMLRHVPEQHRTSPRYLFSLKCQQLHEEAGQFVLEMDAFLAQALARHASGDLDSTGLQACVSDRIGAMAGWWQAPLENLTPALEKYVTWVLTSPLLSAQKCELLQAGGTDHGRSADSSAGSSVNGGLTWAIAGGWDPLVETYTRLVAGAPDSALAPEHRQVLLSLSLPAGLDGTTPLLHHLAGVGIEQLPDTVIKGIAAFVRGIVESPLSFEEKAALCGAAYEADPHAQSAVQRALAAGHPQVASAIVFAIMAAEPDLQRRADLLAVLKVDFQELRAALRVRMEQRQAALAIQESGAR